MYSGTSNNAASNYRSLKNTRESIQSDLNDQGVKNVETRIYVAEMMIKAMWGLLKKNGISDDELSAELQSIMEDRKNNKYALPRYDCPTCGKVMQVSKTNPFIANCMYCGGKRSILPYGMSADEVIKPEEKSSTEEGNIQDTSFPDFLI